MADVKAFRALRYTPEFKNIYQELYTPPYDVITKEMQDDFYKRNPYNMIRLEYGKINADDDENNNRYTRAAQDFELWQKNKILQRDMRPAFYLYLQDYIYNNQTISRTSFLATIKAEGYTSGQVLPHEDTLPKQKEDRLKLMEHTFANFSPIFGLYAEKDGAIDRNLHDEMEVRHADADVTDDKGVRHRLWKIDDEESVKFIEKKMSNLKVYIADGHHRYETASTFAAEAAQKGIKGCDYMMIDLVNLYDEGLMIMPTHRMIRKMRLLDLHTLLEKLLAAGFTITGVSGYDPNKAMENLLHKMKESGNKIPSFGLYCEGQFYLLTLPDLESILPKVHPDRSMAYRKLDVTLLHTLVLENIFGIGDKQLAEEGWLTYTQDVKETVSKVDNGENQCSFLLNSTPIESLLEIAEAGDKMPQKSTFFYPKVITGLAINKLGE